ncbi:MAG TPA: ABC transporter substrate-binding protein [Chloroflexi bacterium]|nr:MAG: hypothetical protein B6243_05800 [Anaerolineaceae bacterium 4572_5.2]HEY84263.1 ABC transporter substrate-binding protein [Chloroflexota bacterium]
MANDEWRMTNYELRNSGQRSFVIRRSSLVIILLSFLLTACAFPGSTKPVIKIGMIAPFDGLLRHQGYQRLYGVKLALQEVNLSGGVAGYKTELVALNDFADEDETILQAQELVLDSDVRGIIGQWDATLFNAAAPIYSAAQLAVVNPSQFTHATDLPDTFATDFEALSGSPPNPEAQQAYLSTRRLLKAIEEAVEATGRPERANVSEKLKMQSSK